MERRQVYHNSYFDASDDETMGFAFLAPLIAAAPGIFQSIMGLFGGGRKAQCQGLAEINNCGRQAVDSMQQILAGVQSGQMPPAQAAQKAQEIIQKFNDPTIVYPAKKGNDAAARTQFIAQLSDLQKQIQAASATVAANAQNPLAAGLGGVSTETLLLIGGGAAVLYFLTRSKE